MGMMEEFPSQPKLFRMVAAWAVGLVVLIGVILIALWAFGVFTADVKGRGDARKQLKSASYRIGAYDHFFDLCASIQGVEAALAASREELKTAAPDDKQRIRTNITGLVAQRGRSIAEYNADARKSYTLGQFRSSDLPYQLDPAKGATECTA